MLIGRSILKDVMLVDVSSENIAPHLHSLATPAANTDKAEVSQKWTFHAILVLLALIGMGTAVLRHLSAGTPFLPGQEKFVWLVEARIDFDVAEGPVSASLSLPDVQLPGFELFEEQTASPGYGFTVTGQGDNRRAEWTKRDAEGEQSLYYSAQLVESDSDGVSAPEGAFLVSGVQLVIGRMCKSWQRSRCLILRGKSPALP